MRVIPLVNVDDTALVNSNVPENDYPVWAAPNSYGIGARVIVLATHAIYESTAANNVGNDPTLGDISKWVYVSKTNRWRAFDGRNSAKTRQADSITYELLISRTTEVLALTGLEGQSVKVELFDGANVLVLEETRQLLDTSNIKTWFQYYTFEADEFVDSLVFYPISAFAGYTLKITITAVSGGSAAVSIIGYGRRRVIGRLIAGTTPSLVDYSTKEVDEFGERNIVVRAYAREIRFALELMTDDYGRVDRLLTQLRATPAIYYEGEDLKYNLIVLGIFTDFSPPLQARVTLASLTVLGDI